MKFYAVVPTVPKQSSPRPWFFTVIFNAVLIALSVVIRCLTLHHCTFLITWVPNHTSRTLLWLKKNKRGKCLHAFMDCWKEKQWVPLLMRKVEASYPGSTSAEGLQHRCSCTDLSFYSVPVRFPLPPVWKPEKFPLTQLRVLWPHAVCFFWSAVAVIKGLLLVLLVVLSKTILPE